MDRPRWRSSPNDLVKARRWATRALRESAIFGDPDSTTFARLLRGRIEYIRGEPAKAEGILAELVDDPAVTGDDRAYALLWLGRALVDRDELTRAEAALIEADARFVESGEFEGRVDVAGSLAHIYVQTDRESEARDILREAGRLATLLGWADRTFSTGIEATRIGHQAGRCAAALAEALALVVGKLQLAAKALRQLNAMPTSAITVYAAAVGWAATQEFEVASGRSVAFAHASLLRARSVTGDTLKEVDRTVSLLGGQW